MWIPLIFLMSVSLAFCGECGQSKNAHLSDKIVGGMPAEEGQFSWVGALEKYIMKQFYPVCAASLLNPYWLATAAHCFDDESPLSSYRVVLGRNNLTQATKDNFFSICVVVIKQGFSTKTFHNDTALIKLCLPAPNSVSSICLPEKPADVNLTAVVAGWGVTKKNGRPSDVLLATDVKVIPYNDCLQYYPYITDSMMCAGYKEGGKDACQGDSGGPLMLLRDGKMYLIGIVSWGEGCADPGKPGVYTDVSLFTSWIKFYIDG